ncbi:MAG: pilus assembly protein TadG-related protein [Actinomycetota bacterium]
MNRFGRDAGAITVVAMFLLIISLLGAGLVVDGGRAMAARRHAYNTAEAAARAGVATATPMSGFSPTRARAAALDYALRSGVAARDVAVVVTADRVSVTITERRRSVFLILGGWKTVAVRATGTARLAYST